MTKELFSDDVNIEGQRFVKGALRTLAIATLGLVSYGFAEGIEPVWLQNAAENIIGWGFGIASGASFVVTALHGFAAQDRHWSMDN